MAGFAVMIENVDSSTVLGSQIPLNKLVAKVGTAQYEPEQFPGIIYRLTDPRAASLIFSSGKIFCTGTKSIEDARKAVSKVVEKVRKTGIKVPRSYIVARSKSWIRQRCFAAHARHQNRSFKVHRPPL